MEVETDGIVRQRWEIAESPDGHHVAVRWMIATKAIVLDRENAERLGTYLIRWANGGAEHDRTMTRPKN